MHSKSQILDRMALYRVQGGGIGSWLSDSTCDAVFERLARIDERSLPAVQLNQLLVLGHEAPVSDGFYTYYWLDAPTSHPYDIRSLTTFDPDWIGAGAIVSLEHLAWGIHRLYVDGLLYFGNVRTAFRCLREQSSHELREYFRAKQVDTDAIKRRGPPLPLRPIEKHARYLISEMACKSYGEDAQVRSDLRDALDRAYETHRAGGSSGTTVKLLLENCLPPELQSKQVELLFSASEILAETPTSKNDIARLYLGVARKFEAARSDALKNTDLYLSMLTELDVYVATSMRTPANFVSMADTCETVFRDPKLSSMNLRYFDPTLSAASGHEDKGLIECLMVKCAKALVYCAGEKESYGKDAEAAMALSLGRPVIFYCEQRAPFYREIHPLTRLIEFQTGVAVGAMIADNLDQVVELLSRIFENRMVYRLERSKSGSLRLLEDLTGSVVRLQTSNKLLSETFWNHYHHDRTGRQRASAPVLAFERARELKIPRTSILSNQPQLPLGHTSTVTQLAARSPPQAPAYDKKQVKERVPAEAPRAGEPFPLTVAEIYDGIAKQKSTQVTGAKRFGIFSAWLEVERVGIVEGIRLLRFIEETLASSEARSGFVFTKSDLTRWYQEMSNGEVVGSRR